MRSTKIIDWSLEGFLRNTTLGVNDFLKSLRLLASHKKLEEALKTFALQQRAYYSGKMGENRIKVIKQKLARDSNRRVISGQEHLINQGNLQEQLELELSCASSSSATTSSSDRLTSSQDQLCSIKWQTEYDPIAGADLSAGEDDSEKTSVTPPFAALDTEDGSDQEDGLEEDHNAQGAAPAFNTSSNMRKRVRTAYTTEEPWCSLISSLTKLIHGETNVTFPVAMPHMSTAHTQLFEHAVDSLKKYQAQGCNQDVILLKDAHKYLECEVLLPAAKMRDKVLEILTTLCTFVLQPPFGTESPSENDCLLLWTSVFKIITDKLTLHTGEKMLAASKVMRHMQAIEHGDVADTGRKVDCIFMYKGIELSNVEFKRSDVGTRDLEIQNRKNIRLARCIQEVHTSLGVEKPYVFMADVYGFVGIFYQVQPMDDISIAGKTTPSLVYLPRTTGGLRAFLKGNSLAIIWNFI
ncbi:hypothetical protein BGW38_006712, partial [Lunasporangiospora selenospora]